MWGERERERDGVRERERAACTHGNGSLCSPEEAQKGQRDEVDHSLDFMQETADRIKHHMRIIERVQAHLRARESRHRETVCIHLCLGCPRARS